MRVKRFTRTQLCQAAAQTSANLFPLAALHKSPIRQRCWAYYGAEEFESTNRQWNPCELQVCALFSLHDHRSVSGFEMMRWNTVRTGGGPRELSKVLNQENHAWKSALAS